MSNFKMWLSIALVSLTPSIMSAEEYRYNAIGKADPFQSLAAAQNVVFGSAGRLQKYELAELSLVGTAIGKDSTALIMTPSPIEGFLVRVGDSIGKRGGKIVSLTKKEMIIREFMDGTAGSALKSNLFVMSLSSKMTDLKDKITNTEKPKSEEFNFDSLSSDVEIQQAKTSQNGITNERNALDNASQTTKLPTPSTPAGATSLTIPPASAAPKLSDVPAEPFKGINP